MGKKTASFFRYIILIILFIAVFAGIRYFFGLQEPVVYTAPVKAVVVTKPEYRTIEKSISVTGYIEAEAMIPVVPFVSGTIMEYNAAAGKLVQEDEVLAVIDKAPYELQVAQAKAQYTALESSFSRTEPLYEAGAVSRQDYETLLAQRDAAKAQLELAELQLSYTDVTAPVKGTVVMAPSAAGSIGSSSDFIAVIADLDSLVVNLAVSERYYDMVTEDPSSLRITVTRPSSERSSEAEIVSIAPYVDPATKTFKVKVRLTEPSGFVPGMYVKVSVTYSSEECYALPVSAVTIDDGVYYVEDNIAYFMPVEVDFSLSSYFPVDEAYKDRDFVVRGQTALLSGESVNILEN